MTATLSALDSTFLELEQADPSAHMHIGAVLVFGRTRAGHPPTAAQLQRRLSGRLAALPRFTQCLSEATVSGLRRPEWVPDAHFDLARHVRRAALPAPGGDDELAEWAGEYYSRRLDRDRPLWEVTILEGLADDRWALATKVHHCLADGVGSLQMANLFADGAAPEAPHDAPAAPGAGVTGLVRSGLSAVRHPRRTAAQAEALTALVVANEVIGSPASPINVPIGPHRRVAVAHADLADVQAIRHGLTGTVNDVVVTAVTSGLRDLLLARGEPPETGLRAMVPVNVRTGSGAELGNRISSRFYTLPVDFPHLLDRHHAVVEAGRRVKRGRQPAGAASLLGLAEHLPPVLHTVFAQSLFGTRLFNITVTNVPGPATAMRMFGGRLQDVIPIVPLAAEHAIGVAIISHAGRLTFAINADRDVVPDAQIVADGIERALAELGAAAGHHEVREIRNLVP